MEMSHFTETSAKVRSHSHRYGQWTALPYTYASADMITDSITADQINGLMCTLAIRYKRVEVKSESSIAKDRCEIVSPREDGNDKDFIRREGI